VKRRLRAQWRFQSSAGEEFVYLGIGVGLPRVEVTHDDRRHVFRIMGQILQHGAVLLEFFVHGNSRFGVHGIDAPLAAAYFDRCSECDATSFAWTRIRQYDSFYVRERIDAEDSNTSLFFITSLRGRRRGPRIVNSERVRKGFRGVAVIGPLLISIDFLQAQNRRAAHFRIFMERSEETFEFLAATPANVVGNDFDLVDRRRWFS